VAGSGLNGATDANGATGAGEGRQAPVLDRVLAERFARVALENIQRAYPYKVDHLMTGPEDLAPPSVHHPIFHGSYDWHSSVHMHWLLARLLRLYPDLDVAGAIRDALDRQLQPRAVEVERAYFARPSAGTFERPYGWAWLLRLQAELTVLASAEPGAAAWARACAPLADLLAERLVDYLAIADFPIRTGTHFNSAFALVMANAYVRAVPHPALRRAIASRAQQWFGHDRRYPARYEPGGDEFLSGGLMEAMLMRETLDGCGFDEWWEQFSPAEAEFGNWLAPVTVSDRRDPKLSHLDGLNLSRAWCWGVLAPSLPREQAALARQARHAHLSAGLPHAAAGNYAGTHWLASFAALALTEGAEEPRE